MSVLICFCFFFLFTVQVSKVTGGQAFWKMLSLSACLPQRSSLLQSWCSLMCLYVSVPPVMSWVSLFVSSVLHLHQSVPFLASAWLHLTPPPCLFFISHVKMWFITLPNLYFIHFPNTSGTVWAYTVQRLCRHNSFICNKAMQHPGQALPLVDVCLSFLSRKK